MVEGPGCTRNGQKVRSTYIGKTVAGVAGSSAANVANAIRGRVLCSCLTLGKELWLIFEAHGEAKTAVRCHFGMNGSLHCGTQPTHDMPLALLVRFHGAGDLRIFQASVGLADAQAACSAVRELSKRDVCSASFDEAAGVAALRALPVERMVCDALLDQAVLPGTGNIIKNEGLHQACVDPRSPVGSLSVPQLARLVRAVREFSLKWCQNGRPPPCHVYNRSACLDCGGQVSLCKLGCCGAPRPTFWCSARVSGADTCGGPTTERRAVPVSATVMPQSKRQRQGSDSVPDASLTPWTIAAAAVLQPVQPVAALPPQMPSVPSAPLPAPSTGAGCVCPSHGSKRIALRRVRKTGSNHGRLFFGCRETSCQHFVWGDHSFPTCRCVGAPTAGLRISKQTASGGRWFFGCRSTDRTTRCNFFEWATPEATGDGLFGDLLTPLT